MIPPNENRWRISLTSTLSKGYFRDLGIPRPTEYTPLNYSQILPRSTGGVLKQGYLNLLLVWARLDRQELALLETYRSGAGTGVLYLTVDWANEESPGFNWIDITGYPGVLQYANMPGARGNVKTGVQWKFNNITFVNDPASF